MAAEESIAVYSDVTYGWAGEKELKLDIAMPEGKAEAPLPVIMYLHGGGWETGDKAAMLGRGSSKFFAKNGYFAVSVNYRLSGEAIFPAQIHDVKAAVRWIRANAAKYNLDPDKIGVWGHSAGGHLAALLGTSGDVAELEGDVGPQGYSSKVQAVVTSAAPVDLLKMGGWHDEPDSSESRLLGGAVQQRKSLAELANPIRYVSENSPPFLIFHGDEDEMVPYQQAEWLYASLPSATLIRVKHGDHDYNDGNIYWGEIYEMNLIFFNKQLRKPKESEEELQRRRNEMMKQVAFFSRRK